MMTLSRWKFVTVTAAIIFGLLFAVPNLLPAGVRDAIREGLDLLGVSAPEQM